MPINTTYCKLAFDHHFLIDALIRLSISRNNKPLDPSLTFRFSNIPNNGQIDLKAVPTKTTDQKVTLAIDLADGSQRKIGDFDPNQNLLQIIHTLFDGNPALDLQQNTEFCLIFMRKEV